MVGKCCRSSLLVLGLFLISVSTAMASGYERVRIVQESCEIIKTVEDGYNNLNVICEAVSHKTIYGLEDPAPRIQTGIDGQGNRYIDIIAPSGFVHDGEGCYPDQVLICYGDIFGFTHCGCTALTYFLCYGTELSSGSSSAVKTLTAGGGC